MPIDIDNLDSTTRALKKDWTFLEPFDVPVDKVKDRSGVFVRKYKDGAQETQVYVKIYANQKHPFQRMFRSTRSENEVRNLLFFRSLGISTPRIIAWGRQRSTLGHFKGDFIVTEAETGTEQLDQFVQNHCPDPTQPEQKAMRLHMARKLGEWAAKIHHEGFIHEDLKWRNILARPNGEEPELFWIDCPKGRFYNSDQSLARKKLKDCAALDKIAHLQCTQKERRTFIESYLGSSATEQDILEMCQEVENFRRERFDPKDERQREHAKKDQ